MYIWPATFLARCRLLELCSVSLEGFTRKRCCSLGIQLYRILQSKCNIQIGKASQVREGKTCQLTVSETVKEQFSIKSANHMVNSVKLPGQVSLSTNTCTGKIVWISLLLHLPRLRTALQASPEHAGNYIGSECTTCEDSQPLRVIQKSSASVCKLSHSWSVKSCQSFIGRIHWLKLSKYACHACLHCR